MTGIGAELPMQLQGNYAGTCSIVAVRSDGRDWLSWVEWGSGAAAVGRACLLPPLSSGGALVARTELYIMALYATLDCRSPIETSPASPIEMSRSSVGVGLVGVAWDDGDHGERQGADAPAGAD
jgi:hypothetical protein